MSTATHTCDVCSKSFEVLADAEKCEQEHARKKLEDAIVARCGKAVCRCVVEIEKLEGLLPMLRPANWHMLVADVLTAFRKGEFDEPENTDDKRK